jgi:UDP-N-acetylmuramoylalanine--D-glutamate ligase
LQAGLPRRAALPRWNPIFPRIAKAYLIGEAAAEFAASIGERAPFEISGTLDRAVANAARDAGQDRGGRCRPCCLSPACASFDQYRNFEVRGDAFVSLVAALDDIEMLVGAGRKGDVNG